MQIDDQTAEIWWKISSRDANTGANETNNDGNYQSIQKIRCFWCLLQKRALKKQKLHVDDQTAEIWWIISSRDAIQEQTIPISTETSNLDKEYAVSDICCVNGHCRNKTFQIDDQTAQIWWKISSRDANSGVNVTNNDGKKQSLRKKKCFWYLLQRRNLKKQKMQIDD